MSSAGGAVGVSSVRISSKSGRVRIVAESRMDVEVEGRARVVEDRGQTTIETSSDSLVVRVPLDSDVVVGTVSSKITAEGRLGHVAAVSESAPVLIESARSADVRTTSGRIQLGEVEGEVRAHTVSARVTVERSGRAEVSTASGRIGLRNVSGPVHAHCTSGRIEVEMASAHDVEAETVSGRISVSFPDGVHAHQLSDASEPRPAECDCTVLARSTSGRITVT